MIIVLSENDRLEQQVRRVFGAGVHVDTVTPLAGTQVRAQDLAVVIVDGSDDLDQALALADRFDAERPELVTLLFAPAAEGLVAQAMQVGIREVYGPDHDDDHVRDVLKRSLEAAERRQDVLPGAEVTNRLIVVISPKGGAGKTTVSTNLAVGLAQRAPSQVVLADGDLQFGDVTNALRMRAEVGIHDVARGRLDDVAEVKVNLTHHRSGLFVLAAPDTPGAADEITPQAFARAVSMLAWDFRFVIVDTDPGLSERTLSTIEQATDLVLVTATDIPAIRGMTRTLDALDHIGLDRAQRHIVLNRANAEVGLEIDDVRSTIGADLDVLLPSDRSVPLSFNEGSPILEGESRSPAAAPLRGLVDRFLPPEDDGTDAPVEEHKHRRRLFRS